MDGTSGVVRFEPGNVATNGLLLMVGEKECVVIRFRDQSLGDRSHTDCLGFLRGTKVGMANPANEYLTHDFEDNNYSCITTRKFTLLQ